MMSIEGLWILVTLWPDKVTPLHWKVRCRHPSWAPLSTWIWTSLDACSCKDVSMSFDQIDHLQSTLAAIQSRHLEAFWLGIRSTLGGLCLVMEIESMRVVSLRVLVDVGCTSHQTSTHFNDMRSLQQCGQKALGRWRWQPSLGRVSYFGRQGPDDLLSTKHVIPE